MTSTAEDDEASAAARHGPGYDIGRLLAFSDGVFAVAITLLVFGIPVPAVPNDSAHVLAALRSIGPNLIGFALSFLLVGTQWIQHHRLLRQLTFCTGAILWINLLLLMGVCLVPFATSLLVKYGDLAVGAIPYAGLQAGIGVVFLWLRWYLTRHGIDLRRTYVGAWVQILVFLISIPLTLWRVDAAYALWLSGFAIYRVVASGRIGRWTRSPS
jgi:uncharacterized membrane protein